MSVPVLRIETLNDIPNAILRLEQVGAGHRVPVLRALQAGRIAHWEPQRAGAMGLCKRFLAAVQLPALVIIGDDDDAPTGPAGWPVARRLLEWTRIVLVHGTGGQPAHYQEAVALAGVFGRVLLIECCSAMLEPWKGATARWAPGALKRSMEPPPPAVHPVPLERGGLH